MYAIEFAEKMFNNGHDSMEFSKVQQLAKPHWEKLTERQKLDYETEADEAKIVIDEKKRRSTFNGLELEDYLIQLKDMEKLTSKYRDEIIDVITKSSDIDELTFHIISTSHYVHSQRIYPAEIAIVKFNLKYGIHDEINILVKPERLPEELKQLKPAELKDENDYYCEILNEILKFLLPLETIPVFFADNEPRNGNESVTATSKILAHIFKQTQEDEIIPQVKICPAGELFNILRDVAISQKWRNPSPQLFDNLEETSGCDTHRKQDTSYTCCLAKARRRCYTIAKYCCDVMRHDVKAGSHHPHPN